MTFKELGDRIDAHMRRFERTATINVNAEDGKPRFYASRAWNEKTGVRVRYRSYANTYTLSREDATRYLAKLDAGFVGTHIEALA